MYRELCVFTRYVVFQKSIWKDGEIWTALLFGVASFFWFQYDSGVIIQIRAHFGDLLNAASIVFGFVLATLLFYIQTAAVKPKDKRISNIANMIVDWHVWTIICMLALIGYILALWFIGVYIDNSSIFAFILYSLFVFQVIYCGLQILNHTITVWWTFRMRKRLNLNNQN